MTQARTLEETLATIRALPCVNFPEHRWEPGGTLAGHKVAHCRGCQRLGPVELAEQAGGQR